MLRLRKVLAVPTILRMRGKELDSGGKVSFDSRPAGRLLFRRWYPCRLAQLVAHQNLDLGVLGSIPRAAATKSLEESDL
jgi:hypothetical protein